MEILFKMLYCLLHLLMAVACCDLKLSQLILLQHLYHISLVKTHRSRGNASVHVCIREIPEHAARVPHDWL